MTEPKLLTVAKLSIKVLDAQKQYFRTRDRQDLIASKALEAELRKKAVDAIETYNQHNQLLSATPPS